MPIKKLSNILNIREVDSDTVLSVITDGKKNHFSCTLAKLCEMLVDATYTPTGYFNAYISTHPFIAIHIVGDKKMLDLHKNILIENVTKVLNDHHERGNVKIM